MRAKGPKRSQAERQELHNMAILLWVHRLITKAERDRIVRTLAREAKESK